MLSYFDTLGGASTVNAEQKLDLGAKLIGTIVLDLWPMPLEPKVKP